MTARIQNFLLNNTKFLQKLVNEKLANSAFLPNFWKWMEIGKRGYGEHIIPKYFRLYNAILLNFGTRMNWGRPHLMKQLHSKEREFFLTGYAGMLFLMAIYVKKNKLRPLYEQNDSYLHSIDNATYLQSIYGGFIPSYVMKYKRSAHYIEINKIFHQEMTHKVQSFAEEIQREYDNSSEKVKRTKYLRNPNYVYEPFGWELEENKN